MKDPPLGPNVNVSGPSPLCFSYTITLLFAASLVTLNVVSLRSLGAFDFGGMNGSC